MKTNFELNRKVNVIINELIFDIAVLKYDLEIELRGNCNWFVMQPIQEEICLKEYYVKQLKLGNYNKVHYAKAFLRSL